MEMMFPSGVWRGYYHQFGKRHLLCDFVFTFDMQNSRVSGSGVDNVGRYVIDGIVGGERIAFTKAYTLGSVAADGRVNVELNHGHAVQYRGTVIGQNLGQGIKGQWYVSNAASGCPGKGDFHLWPGMPDWRHRSASAPPLDEANESARMPQQMATRLQFEVTSDNVCTVCFDRPIDVCLHPCGHVAVCGTCTKQLRPPNCPICRSNVACVSRYDGNPFALASAPPSSLECRSDMTVPLATAV